jgi:hypothetical protein
MRRFLATFALGMGGFLIVSAVFLLVAIADSQHNRMTITQTLGLSAGCALVGAIMARIAIATLKKL